MAYALTDALILMGGYNISGDLNQVSVALEGGEETDTTFGDTFHSRPGGQVGDVKMSASGFWQSATSAAPDPVAINALGTAGSLVTVAASSAVGSTAYLLGVHEGKYALDNTHGSVSAFTLETSGSVGFGVARGLLMLASTVTGSTTGSGFQLGAVAADQDVYIAIHVTVAGTTADIIIESDDNGSFTSATTRSTTTATTTGAAVVAPVSGAITDDSWRVRAANVTGSFLIAVAVAIK